MLLLLYMYLYQVEMLEKRNKSLQQQLTRRQIEADKSLQELQQDMQMRRESLAGDLEGATVAMHDAASKLAFSEEECYVLRRQLLQSQQEQRRLQLDCEYLRQRFADSAATATKSRKRLTMNMAFSFGVP